MEFSNASAFRCVSLISSGVGSGLVNSSSEFTEQHLVMNGCSELIVEVFGEIGKHARSAFGVAQIPLGACVEIEMIVEI